MVDHGDQGNDHHPGNHADQQSGIKSEHCHVVTSQSNSLPKTSRRVSGLISQAVDDAAGAFSNLIMDPENQKDNRQKYPSCFTKYA